MRLVIDCFKLIKGKGKSIGIYNVAQGIVSHLGELNCKEKKADIIVLGNVENQNDFDVPGVQFVKVDKYNPQNKIDVVCWELFHVHSACKRLKADKVFFPRGFTSLFHSIYDIVLIHDLIPFYYHEHFPHIFNRIENAYIMDRLKKSARGAKKIITISQASKHDIIKYCGVKEDKIVVINNACENKSELTSYTVENTKPYISAMTSGLPHKNAIGIVESYKKYCETVDNPEDLVIIGLDNINDFNIPEEIKEKITCYKYIKSTEDMYKIIKGSNLFLFLSLTEGFGLPPIEAMNLEVPVICSNTSSMPEVVGDAAVLVDPNDYDKIAYQIDAIANDEDKRKELILKGLKNVTRFSWESRTNLYWNEIVNE